MRLFRRLNFASKALVISLAIVVPLLLLLGLQVSNQYQQSMQAHLSATRQQVDELCTACFTGRYPIELPDPEHLGKGVLEASDSAVPQA